MKEQEKKREEEEKDSERTLKTMPNLTLLRTS